MRTLTQVCEAILEDPAGKNPMLGDELAGHAVEILRTLGDNAQLRSTVDTLRQQLEDDRLEAMAVASRYCSTSGV